MLKIPFKYKHINIVPYQLLLVFYWFNRFRCPKRDRLIFYVLIGSKHIYYHLVYQYSPFLSSCLTWRMMIALYSVTILFPNVKFNHSEEKEKGLDIIQLHYFLIVCLIRLQNWLIQNQKYASEVISVSLYIFTLNLFISLNFYFSMQFCGKVN